MSNIQKLKITTYDVPFKLFGDNVSIEINTDLWVENSFEEVTIDNEKENLQLKIKEYVDKMTQFNTRQETYAKSPTYKETTIKRKILQRIKD